MMIDANNKSKSNIATTIDIDIDIDVVDRNNPLSLLEHLKDKDFVTTTIAATATAAVSVGSIRGSSSSSDSDSNENASRDSDSSSQDDNNDYEDESSSSNSSSTSTSTPTPTPTPTPTLNCDCNSNNDNKEQRRQEKEQRVLKVYILAGQSNMVGEASIENLEELATTTNSNIDDGSENTNNYYEHLLNHHDNDNDNINGNENQDDDDNEGGNDDDKGDDEDDNENNVIEWVMHDNVYCVFNGLEGAKLQVGNELCADDDEKFGPEIGFGWTMMSSSSSSSKDDTDIDTDTTDALPIVLIKAAWGGKDLAVDFRPPSSVGGNYGNRIVGVNYQEMMTNIKSTLDSLLQNSTSSTSYTNADSSSNNNNDCCCGGGYLQSALRMKIKESSSSSDDDIYDKNHCWPVNDRILYDTIQVSGFVWFQGWNDHMDDDKTLEYESNLQHFIHDVRYDLNKYRTTRKSSDSNTTNSLPLPILPFIIGEFGQHGIHGDIDDWGDYEGISENTKIIRQSQYNITHVYDEFINNTILVETKQYWKIENANETNIPKQTNYDGVHHYYGRADTIYSIGVDFGKAMIQLENYHQLFQTTTIDDADYYHYYY